MNTTQQPRKNNRKKTLVITAIVLVLAILFVASFAWMSTEQTERNEMTTPGANNDIKLVENWNEEDGKNLYPGADLTKEIGAVNTGTAKGLVRIRLEELFQQYTANSGKDGLEVVNPAEPGERAVDAGDPSKGTYMPILTTKQDMADRAELMGLDPIADSDLPTAFTSGAKLAGGKIIAWGKVDIRQSGNKVTRKITLLAAYEAAGQAYYQQITFGEKAENAVPDADKGKPEAYFDGTFEYLAHIRETPSYQVYFDIPGTNDIDPKPFKTNIGDDVHNDLIILHFGDVRKLSEFSTHGFGDFWYYDDSATDSDGWFYYAQPLESGKSTGKLLESVEVVSAAGDEMAYTRFEINTRMQGIQPTLKAVDAVWDDPVDENTLLNNVLDKKFVQNKMTTAAQNLMKEMLGDTGYTFS